MICERGMVQNTEGRFTKKVCIFAVIWVCIWFGTGKMTANAEPASLQSESAVIYSGMDEAGDVVGNLVRGSSFELLGSATAEDGSSWYRVSAFGVEGYIRGDAEIERGQAATAGDTAAQTGAGTGTAGENGEGNGDMEQDGTDAAAGGEGVAAKENAAQTGEAEGNDAETGAGTAAERNAAGGDGRQVEETGEGAGETVEQSGAADGISGNPTVDYRKTNAREKTYAGGENSLKSKGAGEARGDDSDSRPAGGNATENSAKINITVLFFAAAAVGSVLTALVSYKILRREMGIRENAGGSRQDHRGAAGDKKAVRRKRKHKKKKGKLRKNESAKKQQL